MGKKHQVVILREPGIRKGVTSSSNERGVRYVECQKNHAANIGGYAVDGCMEFLASEDDGRNGAFFCAACGCHRNFHRRVVLGDIAPEVASNFTS